MYQPTSMRSGLLIDSDSDIDVRRGPWRAPAGGCRCSPSPRARSSVSTSATSTSAPSAEPGDHQRDPLHVRERDVDEARRHRPVALRRVVQVVGRVQDLVDHVVARRDQADRQQADDEPPRRARRRRRAGRSLSATTTPGRTKTFLNQWSTRQIWRWARSRSPRDGAGTTRAATTPVAVWSTFNVGSPGTAPPYGGTRLSQRPRGQPSSTNLRQRRGLYNVR